MEDWAKGKKRAFNGLELTFRCQSPNCSLGPARRSFQAWPSFFSLHSPLLNKCYLPPSMDSTPGSMELDQDSSNFFSQWDGCVGAEEITWNSVVTINIQESCASQIGKSLSKRIRANFSRTGGCANPLLGYIMCWSRSSLTFPACGPIFFPFPSGRSEFKSSIFLFFSFLFVFYFYFSIFVSGS